MLITKENENISLSSLGVLVQNFIYEPTQLDVSRRVIKGRSGTLHASARYASKLIHVSGKIRCESIFESQKLQDLLNGLLVDTEPYYITQLLPFDDELYEYESPGESNGDLDLLEIPHIKYNYRFKVVSDTGMSTTFLGKSQAGFLYNFTIDFITAELPFGETVPKNVPLNSSGFKYGGTAPNSQLEYPWHLRMVADQTQDAYFNIEMDGRIFRYESDINIQTGDVFELKGIETLKNGVNVSHYTNYEYFIMNPKINGLNTFGTNFKGAVEIINYVELYK